MRHNTVIVTDENQILGGDGQDVLYSVQDKNIGKNRVARKMRTDFEMRTNPPTP